MKQNILHLFLLLGISCSLHTLSAQQQLFIVGDDGTAAPELYIQDGADAYIYVQGGVTVAGSTANPPDMFVNGGLFIDGGDLLNATNSQTIRFDKSTSGAYSVADPIPTGKKNIGGTVHLMRNGNQNIGYSGIASAGEVHFFNLSIDRSLVAGLTRLSSVTRVTVGSTSISPASGSGILFLEDETLFINADKLDVLNPAVNAIDRAITDALGNPLGGLDIDNQEPTAEGNVVSLGVGRLGRLTAAGPSQYLFPVTVLDGGGVLRYRPATITPGPSAGMFFVSVKAGTPAINSFGTPAPVAVSPNFYWDISKNNLVAGSDYRLYDLYVNITNTNCNPADLIQNLSIAQADAPGGGVWVDENASATLPTSPTALLWAQSTGQVLNGTQTQSPNAIGNAGEQFTLAQQNSPTGPVPCAPFPINLMEITATPIDNSFIRVDWTTELETNNSHFILERSENGNDFYYMTTINTLAPNGTSTTPLNYSYNDFAVVKERRYYYRLRMIDIDNSEKKSNVVSAILYDGNTFISGIFPNPTDGKLNVNITSSTDSEYGFRIYNAIGQEIYKNTIMTKAGQNIVELDLTALAIGPYELVVVENGQNKASFKIMRY